MFGKKFQYGRDFLSLPISLLSWGFTGAGRPRNLQIVINSRYLSTSRLHAFKWMQYAIDRLFAGYAVMEKCDPHILS